MDWEQGFPLTASEIMLEYLSDKDLVQQAELHPQLDLGLELNRRRLGRNVVRKWKLYYAEKKISNLVFGEMPQTNYQALDFSAFPGLNLLRNGRRRTMTEISSLVDDEAFLDKASKAAEAFKPIFNQVFGPMPENATLPDLMHLLERLKSPETMQRAINAMGSVDLDSLMDMMWISMEEPKTPDLPHAPTRMVEPVELDLTALITLADVDKYNPLYSGVDSQQ